MLMDGFTRTEIETSGARIVSAHGGSGPPLLLLHGNPFTHLSWHKFAPRLAREFTVVATDLRGYGDSSKPPSQPDHANYSFRAMAQDNVEVMAALGFDKFLAAGHDRGARVVHRMCLDHPDKVLRASIQDIIPQHHLFNNCDAGVGDRRLSLVLHDPEGADAGTADERRPGFLHREEARQDRSGAVRSSARRRSRNTSAASAIREPCAHVRGLPRLRDVDLAMDTQDFAAGKKITCPVQLLWGATGAGRAAEQAAGDLEALRERHPRRAGAALRPLSLRGSAGGNLSGHAFLLCRLN
jgi:haloacetate dehalogenase